MAGDRSKYLWIVGSHTAKFWPYRSTFFTVFFPRQNGGFPAIFFIEKKILKILPFLARFYFWPKNPGEIITFYHERKSWVWNFYRKKIMKIPLFFGRIFFLLWDYCFWGDFKLTRKIIVVLRRFWSGSENMLFWGDFWIFGYQEWLKFLLYIKIKKRHFGDSRVSAHST